MSDPIERAALHELGGKRYGPTGKDTTNCVRLVAAVLVAIYGDIVLRFWRALMIADPTKPWSNIKAVEEMGIGRVVEQLVPGRWHVIQGWRLLTPDGKVPLGSLAIHPNGHAWLWYEPETPLEESAQIIQATTSPPPWCGPAEWAKQVRPFTSGVRIAVLNEVPQ